MTERLQPAVAVLERPEAAEPAPRDVLEEHALDRIATAAGRSAED